MGKKDQNGGSALDREMFAAGLKWLPTTLAFQLYDALSRRAEQRIADGDHQSADALTDKMFSVNAELARRLKR